MHKDDLIAFEERIKMLFEAGKIRAPVHFSGGNEANLLAVFKAYQAGDWIFSTWRNQLLG